MRVSRREFLGTAAAGAGVAAMGGLAHHPALAAVTLASQPPFDDALLLPHPARPSPPSPRHGPHAHAFAAEDARLCDHGMTAEWRDRHDLGLPGPAQRAP